MKYYLFKVKDSLNQEYYILNNQYIGYIGFDSDNVRARIENEAGLKYNQTEYVLIAQTNYIEEIHPNEKQLHLLNCGSVRFNEEEKEKLIRDFPQFYRHPDQTVYLIYYPSSNSSECWLREKGWLAKKEFKEIR